MKARTIRRLKKRISNRDYCQKRLDYWLWKGKELNTFYKFECSEFFRGATVANCNLRRYNREIPRIEAQIRWYERKINEL